MRVLLLVDVARALVGLGDSARCAVADCEPTFLPFCVANTYFDDGNLSKFVGLLVDKRSGTLTRRER